MTVCVCLDPEPDDEFMEFEYAEQQEAVDEFDEGEDFVEFSPELGPADSFDEDFEDDEGFRPGAVELEEDDFEGFEED